MKIQNGNDNENTNNPSKLITTVISQARFMESRGIATNNGGGEGRFKSGPFLYRKYKFGIKGSNVSSSC